MLICVNILHKFTIKQIKIHVHKGTMKMLKANQLLDELFNIRASRKVKDFKSFEAKVDDFLELNGSEDNLQVMDASIVVKIFREEDFETKCTMAIPVFERLGKTSSWDLHDVHILSCVIRYAKSHNDAYDLSKTALKVLGSHSNDERYTSIKFDILINAASCCLSAKQINGVSCEDLEKIFLEYINAAQSLCDTGTNQTYKAIIQAKKGFYNNNADIVNEAFNILKYNGDYETFRLLQTEARDYNFDVDLNNADKKRFRIIVGDNIRRMRIERKMSMDDLANILGITVGAIGLIERGSRGAPSYAILKLSEAFGVSTDDLYFGTNTLISGSDYKQVLVEKLSILARQLPEDKLDFAVDMLKALQKLN